MEAALRTLLPSVLGEIDFDVHPFQGKSDLRQELPKRLRGYAAWLPESWRIVVVIDRDDESCEELKRELDDAARGAGMSLRTSPGAPWRIVPLWADRRAGGRIAGRAGQIATASSRGLDVLPDDPGMARSDTQQCDRGTLRLPSPLFPVAERVNADAHGAGELDLREPYEAPQRRDVVTGFESARHEAPPKASGDRSCKLCFGQFGDVSHVHSSMYW